MKINKGKEESFMKIYDKEIYQKEQIIKSVLLVVGIFVLGFIVGYLVHNIEKLEYINMLEQNTYNLYKEINSL
ncbi:MAG: hypothetical protein HFJ53_02895 [Clostridia bacterium]|jgi:hypothetical protein|nr:hypothetical protein [Clostridia bacterium]